MPGFGNADAQALRARPWRPRCVMSSRRRCPRRRAAARPGGPPAVPRQPAPHPARHRHPARGAGGDGHARRPRARSQPELPHRGPSLRAVDRRSDDAARARLRAGAQRRQAAGRTAPRPAVLALPREAGRRAPRAHHHSGAAGADRRRRADPQQHAEVGQPAGRRGAQLGAADCPASTTGSARTPSSGTRRPWRARSRPRCSARATWRASGACCRQALRRRACGVSTSTSSPMGSRSASRRRTPPDDRRARRTRRAMRWPPALRRAAPASRTSRWPAAASSCRRARSSSIRRPGSRRASSSRAIS